MSTTYAPVTPRGKDGIEKVGYFPAKVALVSTNRENSGTSSILLLSHDTTELEITAVTGSAALKWLSQSVVDSSVAGTSVITAAGSSNFDSIVPAGTTKRYVVPIATIPRSFSSVQGVNRAEGLYPAVAFKSISGNASVLTAEF